VGEVHWEEHKNVTQGAYVRWTGLQPAWSFVAQVQAVGSVGPGPWSAPSQPVTLALLSLVGGVACTRGGAWGGGGGAQCPLA
jgi:hypothetical protein